MGTPHGTAILPTFPSPSLLFSTSPKLPSWSYFLLSSFILHIQFITNTCCLFPSSPLDQTSFHCHSLHPHLLSSCCSRSDMPSSNPLRATSSSMPMSLYIPSCQADILKFDYICSCCLPMAWGLLLIHISAYKAYVLFLSPLCYSSLAHGISWL